MLPIIETEAKKTVEAMAKRAQDASVRLRQLDAERRLLILQHQWGNLAKSHAGQLYSDDVARRAIQKRIKTTVNVLDMLCRQTCVAYERDPLRSLDGASEDANRAFATVTTEAGLEVQAKHFERYAFGLNVAIVVPVVRNMRLTYMMLLPHAFEMIADPADPMGDPAAVVVEMQNPSDRADSKFTYAVLDDRSWRYFDEHMRPVGRPTVHNAGVFPGTVFRLSNPVDDWYDSFRGTGLVEATLEVAHLRARMDWVRFHQDRFKEMFFSEKLSLLSDQVVSAEAPSEIPMSPQDAEWTVHNVALSIEHHRAHIRDHVEAAAESLGLPVSSVDVSSLVSSVTPLGHLLQHRAAEALRADHVGYLRRAERDLHWKSALVMAGMRHPLASRLPPDVVRQRFKIDYVAAPYLQDPKTQLEVDKAEVDQGLASTYQIYMRRHPGITLDEAIERVNEIAAQEARLDAEYIAHGLPRDSELRGASREQILGTIGGMRSGQARQQPEEEPSL